MRRAIVGCGMALLAVCFVIFAGHWTVAQQSDQAEETIEGSPEDGEENLDVLVESGEADHAQEAHEEEENEEEDHDEDWDDEWEEESEYEIEADILELELIAAHCEHSAMLSEMCEDHARTSSWVISEILEYLDEEEAATFLEQTLSKVEEPSIRRLIRLKLAELYSELDQTEQVKEQLRQLILDR